MESSLTMKLRSSSATLAASPAPARPRFCFVPRACLPAALALFALCAAWPTRVAPQSSGEDHKLTGVVELLIDIRRDARTRKDYATSDKIRLQLLNLGIVLKDEKDGGISYSFA